MKSWHIPYSSDAYKELSDLCRQYGIKLIYKKNNRVAGIKKYDKSLTSDINIGTVSEKTESALKDFKQFMVTKRYSNNTVKSYMNSIRKFFKFYPDKSPDEITLKDVNNFIENYIIANNLSVSYQNQLINALKTFYVKIYNKKLNISLIERPAKTRYLPNVLSAQEIKKIINSIDNLKHRAIISLIYSAGLRRSELINLKIKDIDSCRKVIKISDSKGNKDRYVSLSDKILKMLRDYYKMYRPVYWLFEGAGGNKYSTSSVRNIFEKAKRKAGIKKKITLHGLRHSYATHLHERGIDIRAIQELLGHNSIKTTEIYTHISNKQINKIKSPLDDLDI
ncbi:MAG: tyrosine-type recombinase/integrase [Chlorobi bacterium]|nr:tyrosine-type recombinase/integrase [Chlorobiota bacterium]